VPYNKILYGSKECLLVLIRFSSARLALVDWRRMMVQAVRQYLQPRSIVGEQTVIPGTDGVVMHLKKVEKYGLKAGR
jgi:hypothetical protein